MSEKELRAAQPIDTIMSALTRQGWDSTERHILIELRKAIVNVTANRASPPEYPGLALVPVPDLERLAEFIQPAALAASATDEGPGWRAEVTAGNDRLFTEPVFPNQFARPAVPALDVDVPSLAKAIEAEFRHLVPGSADDYDWFLAATGLIEHYERFRRDYLARVDAALQEKRP